MMRTTRKRVKKAKRAGKRARKNDEVHRLFENRMFCKIVEMFV